jgi:hypothetical protein
MRAAYAGARPPVVEQADAAEIPARLEARLADLPPSCLKLVYQTVVIDYLPADVRAAYVAGMEAYLARAPEAVWLQLEQEPGPDPAFPAAIRATLRGRGDSVASLVLARTGYHPATVAIDGEAVERLRERSA